MVMDNASAIHVAILGVSAIPSFGEGCSVVHMYMSSHSVNAMKELKSEERHSHTAIDLQYVHVVKGSVESTHKVSTSHYMYHTKHCHAAVVSLGTC